MCAHSSYSNAYSERGNVEINITMQLQGDAVIRNSQ